MQKSGEMSVTVIGAEFNPGAAANVAIDELLGHVAEVRDKVAYRFECDRTCTTKILHAPRWVPCPDYCNDSAATTELMEFHGRIVYVKPVVKEPGQKIQREICIFDHDGEVHVTVPFKKDSYALAAALHFVLTENKS